jgi:hypothetical protein
LDGFQSTLAAVGVPAADAFTVALAWLSVRLGTLVVGMIGTKMSRESLVRIGQMRDRLLYFRSNCFTYTALASPRMIYMAFAVVMTPVGGSMGTRALAAVFFLLFLLGIGGLATYAIHLRLGFGRFAVRQNRILILHEPWLRIAPLICFVTWSNLKEEKLSGRQIGSISFFRILYHDENVDRVTVREDHGYVTKFGWLSACCRRTRWWLFGCSHGSSGPSSLAEQ